jgi:hypothetical protein
MIFRLVVALAATVAVYLMQGVPGVLVVDLPVDAPGFHCVVYREAGATLSSGHAAVLGSQDIEDAADAQGGDYLVLWSDSDDVPAEYAEAVSKMAGQPLPQWCLSDSTTRKFVIGTPPTTVPEALAQIKQVRGL